MCAENLLLAGRRSKILELKTDPSIRPQTRMYMHASKGTSRAKDLWNTNRLSHKVGPDLNISPSRLVTLRTAFLRAVGIGILAAAAPAAVVIAFWREDTALVM